MILQINAGDSRAALYPVSFFSSVKSIFRDDADVDADNNGTLSIEAPIRKRIAL